MTIIFTCFCYLGVEIKKSILQKYVESSVVVSILQQRILEDKEELQKMKDDVKKAKAVKAREEQRETENISPNPGGMAVSCGTFGTLRA